MNVPKTKNPKSPKSHDDDKKKHKKPKKKKPKKEARKKATNKKAPRKKTATKPKPTGDPPVNTIVSKPALRKLRRAYDPALLNTMAQGAFEGTYPPAGQLAKVIIDQFYQIEPPTGRLRAREREVVLLTRFAPDADMNFATHVYVGLMEGLTPTEILDVVYLGALYQGAGIYTGAVRAIAKTFGVLASAASSTDAQATATPNILRALRG